MCRVQTPRVRLSVNPDDQNVTTESYFYKRREGRSRRGCRQKIPISILFFKLWLDKRETELERPIQKSQAENRSQACVQSVVSHLSMLLGINVSSPVLDPASRLALPLHRHDFIHSQHHVQSARASQDAAGLGAHSTWSETPRGIDSMIKWLPDKPGGTSVAGIITTPEGQLNLN